MPTDQTAYEFFVSYASADNTAGWVTHFIGELLAEHAKFFPGRTLHEFFDKKAIGPGRDWEHTLHHGIARSRLFLAFISPNYFASEWCRKEWRAWIDTEISKHILTEGVRPVYLVEVTGFTGKGALGEQAVARKIAELCHLPAPHDSFLASAAPSKSKRASVLTIDTFGACSCRSAVPRNLRIQYPVKGSPIRAGISSTSSRIAFRS